MGACVATYLTGVQSVLCNRGNLLHDGAEPRLCSVRDERHRLHRNLGDSKPLGCSKKKKNTEARNACDETNGGSESLKQTENVICQHTVSVLALRNDKQIVSLYNVPLILVFIARMIYHLCSFVSRNDNKGTKIGQKGELKSLVLQHTHRKTGLMC